MRKSKWIVLACILALIGVSGCSSDDDPVDLNGSAVDVAAAQAALNVALAEIADPLEFLGQLIGMLNPGSGAPGTSRVVTCPLSCDPGDVVCIEAGTINLTFTDCAVAGTDMTVDGEITYSPLTSSASFNAVSINGSTAMSGSASIDTSCGLTLTEFNIGDSVLNGTLIVCDQENDWPTAASSLVITVVANGDVYVITFTFNGTSMVDASVDKNLTTVANCDVDLEASTGSCSSP